MPTSHWTMLSMQLAASEHTRWTLPIACHLNSGISEHLQLSSWKYVVHRRRESHAIFLQRFARGLHCLSLANLQSCHKGVLCRKVSNHKALHRNV